MHGCIFLYKTYIRFHIYTLTKKIRVICHDVPVMSHLFLSNSKRRIALHAAKTVLA